MNRWDLRFVGLARYIAMWSKDPSTQVGAVITRPDRTIASVGFNGLPRGVKDTFERLNERNVKYELVVHAEINAILHAREPLVGYSLYTWPMPPCCRCAVQIIQAGITRVIAPVPGERWEASCQQGRSVLQEAGVSSYWTQEVETRF